MEQNNNIKPDNFLVWGILVTVLCCLPTGIVAIFYANKVDTLWFMEKYDEAYKAAQNAKMWTFVSVGVGTVSYLLFFFMGCATLLVSS